VEQLDLMIFEVICFCKTVFDVPNFVIGAHGELEPLARDTLQIYVDCVM